MVSTVAHQLSLGVRLASAPEFCVRHAGLAEWDQAQGWPPQQKESDCAQARAMTTRPAMTISVPTILRALSASPRNSTPKIMTMTNARLMKG